MESKNYLFFKFSFGNNAPEKFEYEQRSLNQGSWQTRKRMNVTVCSIFDKNTGKLILLNQPDQTQIFRFPKRFGRWSLFLAEIYIGRRRNGYLVDCR